MTVKRIAAIILVAAGLAAAGATAAHADTQTLYRGAPATSTLYRG